jgi:hypothetical protein
MLLYLCLVGQNVSREALKQRGFILHILKYPENYNLTVTDPRTIEGMIIQFIS